jgi:hypothetical protein
LVYLVDYQFRGGPPPPKIEATDVDCTGTIDIGDLVYLVNYAFLSGPVPCEQCPGGGSAKVLASEYSGSCDLSIEPIKDGHYRLTIRGDFEQSVAGFEQAYTFDDQAVTIDSVLAGSENRAVNVYYHAANGKLSWGMVDLSGKSQIKSGKSEVASIYFHLNSGSDPVKAELSHDRTVAVDRNALKMPLEINLAGLSDLIPRAYALHQSYPNPFNATTIIKYDLPRPSDAKITIYNILGQTVKTLVNEKMPAGYHEAIWDARNYQGKTVASGVYLYRLEAGEFVANKKMLLLK